MRRLDYFFVSDELQSFVENTEIIAAPSTDHSAICLNIQLLKDVNKGPSFWKFNNSLLHDNTYVEKVRELIKESQRNFESDRIVSPRLRWELLKYEIRKTTIRFSKTKAKTFRNEYQELELKLKEIELSKMWESDKELLEEHSRVRADLEEKSNYITEGLITRSKANWTEYGEKNNKYFLTLEKQRKNKTYVRKIVKNDGEAITDQKMILKEIERFYGNLYKIGVQQVSEEKCYNFLKDIAAAKLSEEEKNYCEGYLTADECLKALKEMGSSKTPGNDGLTKEFYLAFWEELGKELVDCLNANLDCGSMTETQKQTVITLIEKTNKDNRYLDNWRPISLINVDVKICSKALSNRLIYILPKLIDQEQFAFVKGRNIEEPIRLIDDIMHYTKSKNLEHIVFAADFEKAFDSVNRCFIIEVLKTFGFGINFVNWIRLLFSENKACVLNNGAATNFFKVQKGTKQGDPISPYLFILAIEILAVMIRRNDKINGIKLSNAHFKIALFADDTTLFLKDVNALREALKVFDCFYRFSSLKLNKSKSEACWIGKKVKKQTILEDVKWVNLYKDGIKILGINFSYNIDFYNTKNLIEPLEKFKSVLNLWKTRNLTLFGKVQVVRSLALSQLMYVYGKIVVPKRTYQIIKTVIIDFLWNGRKPKIKYETLIAGYDEGGIRLPDFESCIQANRVKWAISLLSKENKIWKIIPQYELISIGGTKAIGVNFDQRKIPRNLHPFYNEVLSCWADYAKQDSITDVIDVLWQPLWNNKHILVGNSACYFKQFADKGIFFIKDLCTKGYNFEWEEVHKKGLNQNFYFYWLSLKKSIPLHWRSILEEASHQHFDENIEEKKKSKKLSTRDIYDLIIRKRIKEPSAKANIERRIDNFTINWEEVYTRIYTTTIDSYTRYFQYKILNNILYLNRDLHRFKLIESPQCSYCHTSAETIDHLFVECICSKNLYIDIKNWCYTKNLELPDHCLESTLLGVSLQSNNVIINQLLIEYKILLYKFRGQGRTPTLRMFINSLLALEKIERKIATRKNKLTFHLQKWNFLSLE